MRQHLVALTAAPGMTVAGGALAVDGANLLTDLGGNLGTPAAPWRFVGLPYQSKPMTQFRIVTREGARVLEVKADESYGNLVHDLSGSASEAKSLSWRWRIELDNPAGEPLQQWRQEQRDLRADFLRLFGETNAVPPLLAVSISADADNTHGHSLALLSDMVLQ